MESSFYQNVFLLTQAVQPSKDFLKYFRERMFDKPNTIGFLHVSHYLLTIYDADRCKKLLQWPVFCKKTEAKYRTDVKDFLTIVASENGDVDFPLILASHLLHASGSKFSTIMWKLSTVALRTYVRRKTEVNLVAPKSGLGEDVSRMILNHAIEQSTKNIEDIDIVVTKKEQEGELFAKEMADSIQRKQEDLFLTRHSLKKLAEEAPVHPDMKRRLADPNDSEVIQMWKHSVDKTLKYLKSNQQRLKEITDMSNNVAAMVASIASTDSNVLDGGRLPNIGMDCVSEIEGLSPETLVILHRLYADGSLVLENFLLLFSSVLLNFRRYLDEDKHGYPDLSGCDSQVQASCEDMKSMSDLFRALHARIANLSSSIHNDRNRDYRANFQNYPFSQYMDNDLFDSVVLKSSPTIQINGNLDPERTDVSERLELTPVEITHNKVLFSRYKRDKDSTPHSLTKLRPKLLVSQINFDDTRSSAISERMSPANRGPNSKLTNLSSTNLSGKYSRLFTSYQRKTSSAFNSGIMSVPGSSRLNSISDMNATCDVYNISELRPHVTTKSKFGNRAMYTPPKRNTNRASSAINDEHKSIATMEVSRIVINEMTELTVETGQSPKIRKSEKSTNRRISISDLVERYRKLHEKSSDVTAHFENSSVASDESGKQ